LAYGVTPWYERGFYLPFASDADGTFLPGGEVQSYGPFLADTWRQAGGYVGRILKGVKPSDLPILQPTRFELVINLKTAKALGLDVPPGLLAPATSSNRRGDVAY